MNEWRVMLLVWEMLWWHSEWSWYFRHTWTVSKAWNLNLEAISCYTDQWGYRSILVGCPGISVWIMGRHELGRNLSGNDGSALKSKTLQHFSLPSFPGNKRLVVSPQSWDPYAHHRPAAKGLPGSPYEGSEGSPVSSFKTTHPHPM